MRVLFVSMFGIGHMFPMVPLAWALRAAGHDVLVATTGDALAAAHAGLPVIDVAPGFDRKAMVARMKEEHGERLHEMLHRKIDDLRQVAGMFARMSEILADGVVALAQHWQPDLIVQSQVQGAGLVAAGKLGIPVVDHGFGFARTDGMPTLHRQHMAEVFDRHGVDDLPNHHATIDVAPPSMLDGPPHGWPLRYVPYNGGATLPDWLTQRPQRPRIAVTLGTLAPSTIGIDPIHRIVELADHLDADFILALGEADLGQLGQLPSNIHPAGWVPLNVLLPTCRAIIHHGGAGTTLTALACGTPQLVLPTGADRHINATAVHRRRAGLTAEPTELTAALLDTLLHDDGLRQAAREVQAEIASLPSPADLVPRLVSFATAPESMPDN